MISVPKDFLQSIQQETAGLHLPQPIFESIQATIDYTAKFETTDPRDPHTLLSSLIGQIASCIFYCRLNIRSTGIPDLTKRYLYKMSSTKGSEADSDPSVGPVRPRLPSWEAKYQEAMRQGESRDGTLLLATISGYWKRLDELIKGWVGTPQEQEINSVLFLSFSLIGDPSWQCLRRFAMNAMEEQKERHMIIPTMSTALEFQVNKCFHKLDYLFQGAHAKISQEKSQGSPMPYTLLECQEAAAFVGNAGLQFLEECTHDKPKFENDVKSWIEEMRNGWKVIDGETALLFACTNELSPTFQGVGEIVRQHMWACMNILHDPDFATACIFKHYRPDYPLPPPMPAGDPLSIDERV